MAEVIAGRYLLSRLLGAGGAGEVWAAWDQAAGREVAIKLLRGASGWSSRQETTALRWLRLPGVARLLDEGALPDGRFVVMELVAGAPFPGQPAPTSADALLPALRSLAAALARVHLLGVVHRDLKPANVLVDGDGRAVLLDFGIATGAAVSDEDRFEFAGTPAYAAPEQTRGEPCGPPADLYALGVLAFEALCGVVPHQDTPLRTLVRRGREPAPPIRALAPDTPAPLAALVDRLLALAPEARPTASEVLVALGAAEPQDTRPLARRFVRADRFFRRGTQALRLLRHRAGPRLDAQEAELARWDQAGLVRRGVDGHLCVDLPALEALAGLMPLEAPPLALSAVAAADLPVLAWTRLAWPAATPARLRRWTGEDPRPAITRLRAQGLIWPLPGGRLGAAASGDPAPGWTPAQRRAAHGRIAHALPPGPLRLRHLLAAGTSPPQLLRDLMANPQISAAELDLGLQLAVDEGDEAAERRMLERRCVQALEADARVAIEEALYALGRAGVAVSDLEALLRGARAAMDGEAARALADLDALSAPQDEDLQVWWQAKRVQAATHLGVQAEARALAALEGWAEARPATRRAGWLSWRGNLAYRQERYAEAAALHVRSAEARSAGLGRIAVWINAAAALLEVPDLDAAIDLAGRAARGARRLRLARLEALAQLLERQTRYRRGDALRSDPMRVAAAVDLGPTDEGLWATLEATLAWRCGDTRLCAQLAQRAAQRLHEAHQPVPGLLARALLQVAQPDASALPALLADVLAGPVAEISLQALGLIAGAHPSIRRDLSAHAAALAATIPLERWGRRLDVLSLEEAMARVLLHCGVPS